MNAFFGGSRKRRIGKDNKLSGGRGGSGSFELRELGEDEYGHIWPVWTRTQCWPPFGSKKTTKQIGGSNKRMEFNPGRVEGIVV